MLKKTRSKVAQKYSNPIFFLLPAQPKQPKQKNSCSKMWPIDQLCIELGYSFLENSTTHTTHQFVKDRWKCSSTSKRLRAICQDKFLVSMWQKVHLYNPNSTALTCEACRQVLTGVLCQSIFLSINPKYSTIIFFH